MKKNWLIIILCSGALLILFPLLVPLRPSIWRVASLFMLSLICAGGLHIVTGMARVISLCHVGFCGVGAYAAGKLALAIGLPPIACIALGTAVAAIAASLLAWITLKLEDLYLTLATLAASEILSNLFRSWTSVTGGANGLTGIPPQSLLRIPLASPDRYFAICSLAALGTLTFITLLEKATFGKSLRVVGDVDILVESFGLRRDTLRLLAFTIGGALAGLSGALQAHIDGFVGPESFGVSQSVSYLCFLVIGGLGRLRSVIIAGIFAVFVSELLRSLRGWQMVILAAIALFMLYWNSRIQIDKRRRVSCGRAIVTEPV